MITLKQYQRLMSEHEKTGNVTVSAMKADLHPQTARKYIRAGKAPQEQQAPHSWRTRPDPLEKVWPEALAMLREAPELSARTVFDHFLARPTSGLEAHHLRTFFRRVRHWRATEGPSREVFFAQRRDPGQLLELDWTHARELGVTIQGEILDHLFLPLRAALLGLAMGHAMRFGVVPEPGGRAAGSPEAVGQEPAAPGHR